MKIDGACLCGSIQFEAEVDPQRVALCHCTDCQINSGSPMGWVVVVARDGLNVTKGALKTFVKIAESGRRRELGFCGECGTRILARPVDGEPGNVSLRAGCVRQRAELRPRLQIWARSAQPWVGQTADLPSIEKQS